MLEKEKAIGRCGVIIGGGGDEEMRCRQWRWRQRGDATSLAAKAMRRCGVGNGGGGNEWMQLHWRWRQRADVASSAAKACMWLFDA